MTTPQVLREVLSPALVRGVGYALLHSLWQGGTLAVLLAGVLPLLRRHRAEVRYAVAAGALATLVLAVGLTFSFYYQAQPSPAQWVAISPVAGGAALGAHAAAAASVATPAAAAATSLAPLAWLQANAGKLEPYLPLVVGAWLLGLLLMSGRLAGGLVYANRLRRAGTQALGAEWQRRLAELARRAGVRQPVALLESARVAGPLVLGHLRPAILLPLGAVAGLSPALLEALLAHELAHIVRRDYLLNLGLAVAEVLFFYHPAVWFMAGCLRAERENCCDDQAAALCGGDRLRVARALAALAELEVTPAAPHLALAAAGTGGRGSLLARVRRLALGRPQAPTLGEGLLAVLLGVVGIAGLSTGVALAAPAGHKIVKALVTTGKQAIAPADTARKPRVTTETIVDTERREVRAVAMSAPDVVVEPQVRLSTTLQGRPPRRDRASTVVIEKDKKGRIVNLLVNGEPVETDAPGKKSKRNKKEKVRTVEVVRVPDVQARGERLERSERPVIIGRAGRLAGPVSRTYSFNMSPDRANEMAQFGLADALNNKDLTTAQRQEMERQLERLKAQGKSLEELTVQPLEEIRLNLNGLAYNPQNWPDAQRRMQEGQQRLREGQRRLQKAHRQLQLLSLTGKADRTAEQADRAAEQADRDAAQADRDAARADRDAELADHANDRAELAARRAELRARIAADAAELRALERTGARQPLTRMPAPPAPPRAPRAPRVPRVPSVPPVPSVPSVPSVPQVPQAPPAPPVPNTIKLREALRQDGLIKDDKHFSFNLSDQSGRVNGEALTPDQVAKYRQLLNLPTTKIKGSKSNFSITVDEN
ncbi:M56 family metallopeptidase [Hymenobacter bucti]|uniref:M56 family metallopeptidase n=1 Tax=Hymenobacter bucti TaxID=1844114 RepID=A0ABW4QSX1_9BACT